VHTKPLPHLRQRRRPLTSPPGRPHGPPQSPEDSDPARPRE
jgi:hypothetical protein